MDETDDKLNDKFNKKSKAKEHQGIRDLDAALKIDEEAERKEKEIKERYERDREALLAEKRKEVDKERAPKQELNGPPPPTGASRWPILSPEEDAKRRVERGKEGELKAAKEERERGLNDLRESEQRHDRRDMRALFKTDATAEQQAKKDAFRRDLKERDKRGREDKGPEREM